MINIYDWNKIDADKKTMLLMRPYVKNNSILEKVKTIISEVKRKGDVALFELTRIYDKAEITNIRVSDDEFKNAEFKSEKKILNTIQIAMRRIQNYQRQCLLKEVIIDSKDGIICKKIPTPIERVGLYVPGGMAPLLSTLLMLAIPAKIAGCRMCILCTPPNSEGNVNPLLLTVAKLCGIDVVCKIGGAQAIAAMAYGTESVPKVNKIVGPGNVWVTLAKQQVANDPEGSAIDMPAGPSEILVIADESAKPDFIASDLLSQAEHGVDSQVILITSSENLAQRVNDCVEKQFNKLSRRNIINESLKNSRIFLVKDIGQAFEVSNQYSPEHLIIQLKESEKYLGLVKNAGAVFMGQWTPESMGDYINGANHVLPTYGYANRLSGLSVVDFMKYISVQTVSKNGLEVFGPIAIELSEIEGLDAHKNAIDIRLDYLRGLNE